MKGKFFLLITVMLVLLGSVSVSAEYKNYFTEGFTDLSKWEYKSQNWPEQPKIEDGKLVLNFAGLRNKAQKITRKFPEEISLSGTSNLTMKLDVNFSETLPISTSFPTVAGIPCNGRLLQNEGKTIYEVMLNGQKYAVGEILPNHSYSIQYVINISENMLKVCLTDKNEDYVKIITITDYHFNDTQALTSLSIFAYCADVNYPALTEVTGLSVYNDEFSIVSAGITDGDTNVRADSSFIVEFSKDVYLESAENGIVITDSDNNRVFTDISYATNTKNKLVVSFPAGLEYNKEYSLKLQKSISDVDGNSLKECTYNFKTELQPFAVSNIACTENGSVVNASAEVRNFSGFEKEVNIFVVIYDGNKLVGGKAEKYIIANGEEGKKITVSPELPDATKTYTKKVFLWGNLGTPEYIKADF